MPEAARGCILMTDGAGVWQWQRVWERAMQAEWCRFALRAIALRTQAGRRQHSAVLHITTTVRRGYCCSPGGFIYGEC